MTGRQIVEVDSMFGKIRAFEADLITDQIRQFGNHTRAEFAFAWSVLDTGMGVFDIGAHIGTFTLGAQRKIGPEAPLLCVEADAGTFAVLRHNTAALPGVEALNALIADKTVRRRAETVAGNTGATAWVPESGAQTGGQATTWTLDRLCAHFFTPDYLKMDIEGLEFAALSASQMVRGRRPVIYVEVSGEQLAKQGHRVADMEDLLRGLGYVFFINTGPRNARIDAFRVSEIASLKRDRRLFDVLCVPRDHPAAALLRQCC